MRPQSFGDLYGAPPVSPEFKRLNPEDDKSPLLITYVTTAVVSRRYHEEELRKFLDGDVSTVNFFATVPLDSEKADERIQSAMLTVQGLESIHAEFCEWIRNTITIDDLLAGCTA
ncbi:hypothetical protein [Lignipirellula cremea]|uniref:Uncharacterized protein n=1 Tax=Lignipirellula cremea TaxID=2528010 RepID=A0A518DZU0_9BACT|nr:hypothetical protein [Lignipirellula cremea]QDU97335.1 hypothetical protein Pla8534_51810 [Lignipirellula cremea]